MRPSYKNQFWTVDRLWMIVVEEDPCISYKEGYDKADKTYKLLNNINKQMWYNNKKYFDMNIPFSYFEIIDEIGDFLEFKK